MYSCLCSVWEVLTLTLKWISVGLGTKRKRVSSKLIVPCDKMRLSEHFLPCFILCFFHTVLSTPVGANLSSLEKGEESLGMKKKRRQVFREDLSPLLGGKIPSGALEWTRLMFNNLDSRGISIPDGYLPSNDRIPPEGTRTSESRIRFFSNNMLVPHIDTTYTIRSPEMPSLTAMAAAVSSAARSDERKGEKRKVGIRVYNQQPKKKMEKGDSVGKQQSRVIHYQKPRSNVEIHVFSPKEMKRLEEDYRNRLIDEILSVMKSLQTTPNRLSSSSSHMNPPQTVEIQRSVEIAFNQHKRRQSSQN